MDKKFQQIVNNLIQGNKGKIFQNSSQNINNLSYEEKKHIESQAVETADALVKYFWDNQTAPLRIGKMLNTLGFLVLLSDSFNNDNLSGALAIDNNAIKDKFKKIIMLNNKDNIGHQRFTIAHELAHYIFDALPGQEYYEAYYRTDENKNNEVREYRANQFAANLLMPKSIFIPRYEYVASKLSDTQKVNMILSLDFGVSKTAVEKRVKELGL